MDEILISYNNISFPIVRDPISEIRINDSFMAYEPKTEKESELKERIKESIKAGLQDIWRPTCDPFLDRYEEIDYQVGKIPGTGSYYLWSRVAQIFNAYTVRATKHLRFGTDLEYHASLGVTIKKLVSSGWEVAKAWNAVAVDSRELGHYRNSDNARNYWLEKTGSRKIFDFCDRANTFKMLDDVQKDGFWLASGDFRSYSYEYPLAKMYHCNNDEKNFDFLASAWYVFQ